MTTYIGSLERRVNKCSNRAWRTLARTQIGRLNRAIEAFKLDVNENTMQALNGEWSFMARIIKSLPPEQPPAPLSGTPEPTKLAEAA